MLTGSCGCGTVRFEVTKAFVSASYCHCTRCQRRSGTAASANARAVPGSVRVVAGAEALGEWAPAGGSEELFCTRCGSPVFSRPPGASDILGVELGAVDGDPGVRPEWRQFVAYAAPWEPIPEDGLPRYPESKPR